MTGVNAISAPVFDHRRRVVLALAVLGDASRFDPFRNGPIARAVRETSLDISRRLGYRDGGGIV
jgi:DNA-binding IclR family transcriptional regulator